MFVQKGVVVLEFDLSATGRGRNRIEATLDEDALLEACLESGAEHYELTSTEMGKRVDVYAGVLELEPLSQALRDRNYPVSTIETRWVPTTVTEVDDPEQAKALLKMIDAIDDLDDIQTVTANFEMADELLETLN